MGQAAHGPRFVLEATQEGLLRGDPRMQKLDGHRPSQLDALALVDDSHGTRRELADDPIPSLQHAAHARIGNGCIGRFHLSEVITCAFAVSVWAAARTMWVHE